MGDLIFFIYVFAGEGEESAQGDSRCAPANMEKKAFTSSRSMSPPFNYLLAMLFARYEVPPRSRRIVIDSYSRREAMSTPFLAQYAVTVRLATRLNAVVPEGIIRKPPCLMALRNSRVCSSANEAFFAEMIFATQVKGRRKATAPSRSPDAINSSPYFESKKAARASQSASMRAAALAEDANGVTSDKLRSSPSFSRLLGKRGKSALSCGTLASASASRTGAMLHSGVSTLGPCGFVVGMFFRTAPTASSCRPAQR